MAKSKNKASEVCSKDERLRAIRVKRMQEQVKKEVDAIAKKIPMESPSDRSDLSKEIQRIHKAMQDAYCRLRSKDCWLTLTEAAKITGVPKSTISRWAEKNMLENNGKRGRDRRFRFASVAFVKLHRLRDHLQGEQYKREAEKWFEELWRKDLRPKVKKIWQELKDQQDASFGLKTKDKWITLKRAGEILCLHEGTVSKLATQGLIEDNGVIGRARRVRKYSVICLEYLRNQHQMDKDDKEVLKDRQKDPFDTD